MLDNSRTAGRQLSAPQLGPVGDPSSGYLCIVQTSASTLKSTEGSVVNPSDDPGAGLARRLKALRLGGLGGRRITQLNLAEALSASAPLISSWERATKPAIPPQARLEAYATFFATERSVSGRKFRLLSVPELTSQERARREDLLQQLVSLREAALGSDDSQAAGGLWRFRAGESVTIICAELPDERKQQMPYANPGNPDYIRGCRFADLDALIELYGHIRASNPANQVNIRTSKELVPEDYTAHLAVLGGVDWNPVTSELLKTIRLPVRQIERKTDSDIGGFKIVGQREGFQPDLSEDGILESDVVHFYRGPNPFNKQRTVTLCNGMYGRGTLGAVRALTDPRFRDRNEGYVREHFAYLQGFSILARVKIVNGEVVPPDWTSPDVRLHEWQEEPGDAASGSAEPIDHSDASPSRLPSGTVSPAHGGSEQPVSG